MKITKEHLNEFYGMCIVLFLIPFFEFKTRIIIYAICVCFIAHRLSQITQ